MSPSLADPSTDPSDACSKLDACRVRLMEMQVSSRVTVKGRVRPVWFQWSEEACLKKSRFDLGVSVRNARWRGCWIGEMHNGNLSTSVAGTPSFEFDKRRRRLGTGNQKARTVLEH